MRKLLFVAVLAALCSCTSVAPQSPIRRPRNAADWYFAAGRVSIHSVAGRANGIVVSFTPRDDAASHHVFQIAAGRALPAIDVGDVDGIIEYRGAELTVVTNDDRMFTFSVAATAEDASVPVGLTSEWLSAVALNHAIRPAAVVTEDLTFYDLGSGGASCAAGDKPSLGCGVSDASGSCSVACPAGTYSCCNKSTPTQPQRCKCVKE
jgi:hypothetical protein